MSTNANTQTRKLVYYVAVTIDHYIARPDGSIEGFPTDGTYVPEFMNSLSDYGAILMGRNTYEFGYQYGMKPGDAAYPFTGLTNYVFSQSIEDFSNEQVRVVRDDPVACVHDLKAQPGKPLWLCGGGALAGSLFDAGEIDELILKVNPVVFGEGIPLFGDSQRECTLDLLDTKIYCDGVIFAHYAVQY